MCGRAAHWRVAHERVARERVARGRDLRCLSAHPRLFPALHPYSPGWTSDLPQLRIEKAVIEDGWIYKG